MTPDEALLTFMPRIDREVTRFLRRNRHWIPLLHIDRQELISEASVMFLRRYPRWRPDRASLKTWLDKAVYGACLDYCSSLADYTFRKRAIRRRAFSMSAPVYRHVLAGEMYDRMNALPDKERHVMDLVYRDGLNQEEASQRIGRTEGRVSQLHTEAINQLRRAVA